MNFSLCLRPVVTAALLAVACGVGAAESGVAKDAAKVITSDSRKANIEQIKKATTDKMVAEHEALAKQLKDSTEAQRKEIIAKMAELKKNFEETLNAMHKQLREDERKRRQNAAPGRR
jgi:elongation factor P--beta-lysine ligase